MDRWLFWSDRGEGKTSVMVQMANDLYNCGYSVTFISGTAEILKLNKDINHLLCSGVNSAYSLAIITEKVKLGRIDFLFVDDMEFVGFSILSILDLQCNVILSVSHYGGAEINKSIPHSFIEECNILEIISGKLSPKDFLFRQTFGDGTRIKYTDIVNSYIRDKKIEQLI